MNTNTDDIYSDPELLSTKYRLGNNPFYEANLVTGLLTEDVGESGSGGILGSPGVGALGTPYQGGGEYIPPPGIGCPHVNQYVWISKTKAIRAKSLIGKDNKIGLYNPLTQSINLLVSAKILENQPLISFETSEGAYGICSYTDKFIKNTADRQGTLLLTADLGDEILRFSDGNLYQDTFVRLEKVGRGPVVVISLLEEFIYTSGSTTKASSLRHNRKYEGGDGNFGAFGIQV